MAISSDYVGCGYFSDTGLAVVVSWLIGQDCPDVSWAGPDWVPVEDVADMLDTSNGDVIALAKSGWLSASCYKGKWEVYAKSVIAALGSLDD